MTNTYKVKSMTIAGLLCALGIMIPMFAPKILMPPATFTLASHVPIFIAMFISPPIAIAVELATSIGFLINGLPLYVFYRALSQLIFVILGAFILKKNGNILLSLKSTVLFAVFISIVHAIAEVLVITWFFWGGDLSAYEDKGYLLAVIGLVGVGTFIHSIVDFSIAIAVWKPLQHVLTIPANAKIRAK